MSHFTRFDNLILLLLVAYYLRFVVLKRIWKYLLSAISIAFAGLYLGPIWYALLVEPPEGDEVALAILLTVLMLIPLLSIHLWLPTKLGKEYKFLKRVTLMAILLLGIAIFLFTYNSWILLVVTLACFYIWIRRSLKHEISLVKNIIYLLIINLVVSVYVFFQLIP